jgi:hypothetical protein
VEASARTKKADGIGHHNSELDFTNAFAPYKIGGQSDVCEERHGTKYVDGYRSNPVSLCAPFEGAFSKGDAARTSITTFARLNSEFYDGKWFGNEARADHVIVAKNVKVYFSKIDVAIGRDGLMQLQPGAIAGDRCTFPGAATTAGSTGSTGSTDVTTGRTALWPASAAPCGSQYLQYDQLFGEAFELQAGVLEPPSCTEWHERPVVFHSSRNFWNAYHGLESMYQLFSALLVAGVAAEQATLVLFDYWPCGPWWDLYAKWFGLTLTLTDLKLFRAPEKGVCFREVITAPYSDFNEIGTVY